MGCNCKCSGATSSKGLKGDKGSAGPAGPQGPLSYSYSQGGTTPYISANISTTVFQEAATILFDGTTKMGTPLAVNVVMRGVGGNTSLILKDITNNVILAERDTIALSAAKEIVNLPINFSSFPLGAAIIELQALNDNVDGHVRIYSLEITF